MSKPRIAITLGDPFGIGPEVVYKTLKNPLTKKICTPIIVGDLKLVSKYGFDEKRFDFLDISSVQKLKRVKPVPTKEGGISSFKALKIATKLAFFKKVDGLVTAPICKKSWAMAGVPFTGHTDFLRHYCNSPDALMIFISENIKCALLSEHIPISKVAKFITKLRVLSVYKNFKKALEITGIKNPRIAFCGLNPHLGDEGAFASEEKNIIEPALEKLKNVVLLPADTAWQKHLAKTYDGIICTYHDQALIPLKIFRTLPAVNWTYGLPFVRTSPLHGTAFDIAGKNKADARSMTQALFFAAKLCR